MNFKLTSKPKTSKKFGLFTSKQSKPSISPSTTNLSQTEINRKAKKRKIDSQIEKIKESDPNIFDYDLYYTNTLTNERAQKRQKIETEKIKREVKYINSMKKNAEIRKKRIGIIEERKNYKNRQKTDHLFGNNKDAYITKAYKKYLNETKLQELKDNIKDENEKTIKNSDGIGFYNNLLDIKCGKMEKNEDKLNENVNENSNDINNDNIVDKSDDVSEEDRNNNINEGEIELKKKEEQFYSEKYIKEYDIVRKSEKDKQIEIEKSVLEKCKNNLTKKDIDEKRARYLERLKKKKQNN